MATYGRSELHITRVEFHVPAEAPWGATWVEVMKAIHAAIAELREMGELREDEEPSDDTISIAPADDELVVSYELRKRATA